MLAKFLVRGFNEYLPNHHQSLRVVLWYNYNAMENVKNTRILLQPSKSSANFNKPRSTKRGRRPVNDDTTSSDDFTVDRVSTVSNSIATPMQCYGHKCRHMARPGSKYCSDNCGINLVIITLLVCCIVILQVYRVLFQ